jgi:8-oxo-dGTP pyrophosphatase MutT (NUDIX family)
VAQRKLQVERLRNFLAQRPKLSTEGVSTSTIYTPSAVLAPLFVHNGEPHLLFTKRSYEVEHYKGHISFPGGAYHPVEDGSLLFTALRETEEEIGLKPEHVNVVGELDSLISMSGGFFIAPFVGVFPHPYPFQPSPIEVAELIEVPLSHLLDRRFSWEERRPDGRMGWFFNYYGQVVWGSTAVIVRQLLDIIQEEGFLE